MKKIYGLRRVGTDLWVKKFCSNIGEEYYNVGLGTLAKAKLYSRKCTAQGLATKANKGVTNPNLMLEVVEFDLTEVKPEKAPNWEEFKKYIDEEIAKIKPLKPLTPFTPWNPAPHPIDEDKSWQPRRRPPWNQPEVWCGGKPPNEPIMMNTAENQSLMVASATGE